jgi:hypothetical protein
MRIGDAPADAMIAAMSTTPLKDKDLEVQFKPESGKAVIEGKTTVPFQAFVQLILQRKVLQLFKEWGKSPIIVDSELLTSMASAPQDSVENKSNLVMVSLGVGVLGGIVLLAAVQVALNTLRITLTMQHLLILIGIIAGLGLLAYVLMKTQRGKKGEKMLETMESLSSFLSK